MQKPAISHGETDGDSGVQASCQECEDLPFDNPRLGTPRAFVASSRKFAPALKALSGPYARYNPSCALACAAGAPGETKPSKEAKPSKAKKQARRRVRVRGVKRSPRFRSKDLQEEVNYTE